VLCFFAVTTATAAATAGTDFTVDGFKCVLEYLYTGAVTAVTIINSNSSVDASKLRHTVQAAGYFNMPKLRAAALQSADAAGIAVEVARTEPDGDTLADVAVVEASNVCTDNGCDDSEYEYPSAAESDDDSTGATADCMDCDAV
jgi:predicted RecA/RadA family phage recombinase